jgi:hypothetical protein
MLRIEFPSKQCLQVCNLFRDLADMDRKYRQSAGSRTGAGSIIDLMGLMMRTLIVSDRNAAKEILGISVPLFCACLGAETLSSEMVTALSERTCSHVKSIVHSLSHEKTCQILNR